MTAVETREAVKRIFVAVGTDHHPFDRLIEWVDRWLADQTSSVLCVVQAGASAPSRVAESHEHLGYDQMLRELGRADIVICHGGPATISDCRRQGILPIVVPRRPDLGEHIDGHQVEFAQLVAQQGWAHVALDELTFRRLLDDAISGRPGAAGRVSPTALRGDSELAVQRFAEEVDELTHPDRLRSERRGADQVTVAFIAGWGRSGSTLLALALGELPGVVTVGELREIWRRGCVENRLTGRGVPFQDSEFWIDVGKAAFGGWDRIDPGEVLALQARVDRPWMMPLTVFPKVGCRLRGDVARYLDLLSRLVHAIALVSEARVIVDSSKIPSHGLLLRGIAGVDVRTIHCVRDPRAVAYSWQKRVQKPDSTTEPDEMLRYGEWSAGIRYSAYNSLSVLPKLLGDEYLQIRYEDFVPDAKAHLLRLARFLGLDPTDEDLAFISDGVLHRHPNETIDGNPVRVGDGPLTLRLDAEWRRGLAKRSRRTVSALTYPLLRRYGYVERA